MPERAAHGHILLDPHEAEEFLIDVFESRVREFWTRALLYAGDEIDLDRLDRIEAEMRAAHAVAMNALRERLRDGA